MTASPDRLPPSPRVSSAVGLALLAGLALGGCRAGAPAAKTTAVTPPTVSVATVTLQPLKGGLEASGVLVSREEAAVSTELNGYRVAQVFVDQGAHVAQGQPLAKLDDTLLRAQIAQQQAVVNQQKVAGERAQAEAQRVAGLDNQGVLPQEQIIERRLAAKSAVAAVAAAQAQLDDLLTRERMMTVRAPVAGVILARTVRPGDVSAPANTLFRLARGGIVELNAEVPEAALGRIKAGDHAQVRLPSGGTVEGVVRLVSPEVDAQTKLGHARITLPVRTDLRPGGFAKADFVDAARPAAVTPESAVRFDADGAFVMVLGPDDRARRVAVKTGGRAAGLVELVEGPQPGARVLLGGGAFVLDGDRVRPVAAVAPTDGSGA